MLYDLTHTVREGMPVFPGTGAPTLPPANTLEKDGFRETWLHMTSHTGTHMDAPAHLLPEGAALDALPPDRFCGTALVLDCAALGGGRSVTEEVLRALGPGLRQAEFLLLRTGFEALWGTEAFYGDFATLDEAAARYLVSLGLKGVGTDALSADPLEDETLAVHQILLGAGLVSIENLCLNRLEGGELYAFFALPLKFEHADGAPVRAVARR